MARTVFALLCALLMQWGKGQWESAGLPFQTIGIYNVHKDTLDDALYCCGETYVSGAWALSKYQDGSWSPIGSFQGPPFTIARIGDTLFVGGNYPSGNGLLVPELQCLVNDEWLPCGSYGGPIYRLKLVGDELYAIGAFDVVNGQNCQGIAKRENGQWVPVGSFNVINPPNIQDLVEWNGALYATGTIRFSAPNAKDIAYLSPSGEWLPLGSGIQGGFGAGRSLAVYNNELYVSGSIPINAGNAGHGIMRWDGNQFHPVGTGFQGLDGLYTYLVGAIEMEVYDDKLWACGTFSYAGNVPSPGIAYWDGNRWCGLPAGIQPEVNSIEFFHDTLFASCNNWDINCAMRFTGSEYSDTCSVAVGVEEGPAIPQTTLRAWRRGDGRIEIMGVPPGRFEIALNDATGRIIRSGTFIVQPGGPAIWDIGPLAGAYYLLAIRGVGSVRFLGP